MGVPREDDELNYRMKRIDDITRSHKKEDAGIYKDQYLMLVLLTAV